jgi:hypothetical protein
MGGIAGEAAQEGGAIDAAVSASQSPSRHAISGPTRIGQMLRSCGLPVDCIPGLSLYSPAAELVFARGGLDVRDSPDLERINQLTAD